MNCKCSRRNSWHQIAWTRTCLMKFSIDQCQETYLGKREFKLYSTSSWVATNMLERGPVVAVSMKITAQHSVKVEKLNKIEFWISRKAKKKKYPFLPSIHPWCASTLNMLWKDYPSFTCLRSNTWELKKSSVPWQGWPEEWNSFHRRNNPNRLHLKKWRMETQERYINLVYMNTELRLPLSPDAAENIKCGEEFQVNIKRYLTMLHGLADQQTCCHKKSWVFHWLKRQLYRLIEETP